MSYSLTYSYNPENEVVAVFSNAEVTVSGEPGRVTMDWNRYLESHYDRERRYIVLVKVKELERMFVPIAGNLPLWAENMPALWYENVFLKHLTAEAYKWAMHTWGNRRFFPGKKYLERACRETSLEKPHEAEQAREAFLAAQGWSFLCEFGRQKIQEASKCDIETISLVRTWCAKCGDSRKTGYPTVHDLGYRVSFREQVAFFSSHLMPQFDGSELAIAAREGLGAMLKLSFQPARLCFGPGFSKEDFAELWVNNWENRPQCEEMFLKLSAGLQNA